MKKICSLILTVTLIGSTAISAETDDSGRSKGSGATYVSVETNEPTYEKKIDILKKHGILVNDIPEKTELLTRQKFVAVACRMMMIKEDAAAESEFSDVTENTEYAGYISAAKKVGLINGCGDGTFRPDNSITYDEAVKILVTCLGYAPLADSTGGYPTGYMSVASKIALTDGLSFDGRDFVATENAVQLINNALDIPLMQQVGFGAAVEYKIADGSNGDKVITLTTRLENK